MFNVTPIPAFDDNYIWLLQRPGHREVVLVDPGDADPVSARLDANDLVPTAILVTHHHYDHVGGVGELAARFDPAVYGPAEESIATITHPVGEGDVIELPALGASLRVLDVPGHTRGHVAYLGEGRLFCGDTLFAAGCGRLFEGTPQQMQASLEKLRRLPDETLVYCAHEYTQANLDFARVVEPDNPALLSRIETERERRRRGEPTVPSILGLEKATNPFLRYLEPDVIAAAERHAGRTLDGPIEVFATVRAWKDELD